MAVVTICARPAAVTAPIIRGRVQRCARPTSTNGSQWVGRAACRKAVTKPAPRRDRITGCSRSDGVIATPVACYYITVEGGLVFYGEAADPRFFARPR